MGACCHRPRYLKNEWRIPGRRRRVMDETVCRVDTTGLSRMRIEKAAFNCFVFRVLAGMYYEYELVLENECVYYPCTYMCAG